MEAKRRLQIPLLAKFFLTLYVHIHALIWRNTVNLIGILIGCPLVRTVRKPVGLAKRNQYKLSCNPNFQQWEKTAVML